MPTNGGSFKFAQYDAFDSDPGKDSRKTCGIDIKILFTPNKTVVSDQISFVQIMKADKGGSPLLFPNEKPRATEAKDGDAGWAVDRLAGNKNADYQIGNDGKEVPGWGQIGHRKSDADIRDSTLEDGVRLPRDAGQTFKVQATSFALDKTNNKYLGGVAWGYEVDAKGKMTKTPESIQSMGDPGGIQKRALERWNEQAKNPDKPSATTTTSSRSKYPDAVTCGRAVVFCLSIPRSILIACGSGPPPPSPRTPMNPPELAVLDQVDVFSYLAADPLFSDAQLHTLARLPDPAQALRGVIVDAAAPLARRYAAVEAAVQGSWAAWMQRDADARAVAAVLAHGMAHDQIHNRWGMPGQFVGPTGQILVGLPAGVRAALEPLLSDPRPLEIMGSQAATLQRANRYRICDLAAYLLAQHEHVAWQDSPDPAVRDQSNARLRTAPGH